MGHSIIHVRESGKRYFNVNGRKIYIERGVSQKTITKIYKTLQKSVKPKKAKLMYIPAFNKASAVIKQYINTHPITRRRRRNHKKKSKSEEFQSSLNDSNRVSSSGSSHPKDSGDNDLVNKTINDFNKKLEEEKRKKDEEEKNQDQNFVVPYSGQQPRRMQRNYPHGYSTQERMQELNYDPRYRRLINMLNPPQDEMDNVLIDHLLLDLYNSPSMNVQRPDAVEEVEDPHGEPPELESKLYSTPVHSTMPDIKKEPGSSIGLAYLKQIVSIYVR